jgi:outer membrane usher protein
VEVPKGEGAGVLGSQARINRSGFAVVPNLSPYYLNDVQVTLEGASSEVEIDNASQKIAPVEGSIVRIKFNATTGKPLLLHLSTHQGVRIPIGGTVTDTAGHEVGTVGQGSRALIRVQKNADTLKVQWGDKPDQMCTTHYHIDTQSDTNVAGFTVLKLSCEFTMPVLNAQAQASPANSPVQTPQPRSP